jgi:Flp pilus assembly protein TadB
MKKLTSIALYALIALLMVMQINAAVFTPMPKALLHVVIFFGLALWLVARIKRARKSGESQPTQGGSANDEKYEGH